METLSSLTPQSSSFFFLAWVSLGFPNVLGTTGSFVCFFGFLAWRVAQVYYCGWETDNC